MNFCACGEEIPLAATRCPECIEIEEENRRAEKESQSIVQEIEDQEIEYNEIRRIEDEWGRLREG